MAAVAEVWVLIWEGDHEPSDVLGVFTTPELGMDHPRALTRDGNRREGWAQEDSGLYEGEWHCEIGHIEGLSLVRYVVDAEDR